MLLIFRLRNAVWKQPRVMINSGNVNRWGGAHGKYVRYDDNGRNKYFSQSILHIKRDKFQDINHIVRAIPDCINTNYCKYKVENIIRKTIGEISKLSRIVFAV